MIPYNGAVCRSYVLGDKVLSEHFASFKTPEDRFGEIALKKVFIKIIVPSDEYSEQYSLRLTGYLHVHNRELVQLLHEQIVKYGWVEFFLALKTLVRRYLRKEDNMIKKTRLFKAADKLDDIPKTVVVPRNFKL